MKVAPPGELFNIIIDLTKNVDKAPLLYLKQGLALVLCEMKLFTPGPRLPDVQFVWRDIQVAAEKNVSIRGKSSVKIVSKATEPVQLIAKFIRPEPGSVWCVDVDNSDTSDQRREHPTRSIGSLVG